MNISYVTWKNWDAVKCRLGKCELVVGISAGPRILAASIGGGENLLYEDQSDFRVGNWRIYGGHRFSTAPENEESYYPDNGACTVWMDASQVKISAKERPDGLLLSLQISAAPDGGFNILHSLLNNGLTDWSGALWAITCVQRSAQIRALCCTSTIHYWPGTAAENWTQEPDEITVLPGNFRAKVGWYAEKPILTAIQAAGTIIIQSPEVANPATCVDNGSNTEIFVCPDFAELETLSSLRLLRPGYTAQHLEQWQLFPTTLQSATT